MDRRWVIDAGPLIILGKLAHIGLLDSLSPYWIVPAGVAQEIGQGPPQDPARQWLEGEGRKRVQHLEHIDPTVMSWDLGLGESEVLSWARIHPGFEATVDELAARRCAAALHIPVRGTVGILVLAKQVGLVPQVRDLLDGLIAHGYRLDSILYRKALLLAGEDS